jgi:heme iron utilization protein
MGKRMSADNPSGENKLRQMLASFDDLRFAVLATSDEGRPYASLIAFALTPDRTTVIFATPKATRKYRNMMRQRFVSILIDNRSQTPEDLSHAEAVTLLGTARPVRTGSKKAEYSKIFSDRHPQLASFIGEPDTALVAVVVEEAIHVTQFQNVAVWKREA